MADNNRAVCSCARRRKLPPGGSQCQGANKLPCFQILPCISPFKTFVHKVVPCDAETMRP